MWDIEKQNEIWDKVKMFSASKDYIRFTKDPLTFDELDHSKLQTPMIKK